MKFRSLLYTTPIALTLGWGCSVNEADLGSNGAGSAGTSAGNAASGRDGSSGSDAAGATGGSAGMDTNPGSGGTPSAGGTGAEAGRDATDGGSDGQPGGTSGDGGTGGVPECACPYPPILGGDCCAAKDACETDGVSCDELRDSVTDLREAVRGLREQNADDEALQVAYACADRLSDALVERCGFVPPACGDPMGKRATFGDYGGYSECTTEETRGALRCGQLGSYYGPTCCQRERCQDDGVCPGGRCIYRLVQSPDQNPGVPHAEYCRLEPEGCTCSWPLAYEAHPAYCIGDDEDVAYFDCNTGNPSCTDLERWRTRLSQELESEDITNEAASAYQACEEKITIELDERCSDPPADCRTAGCSEGNQCAACQDSSRETHWVCLPDGAVC